jgi:hypothetical protein
MFNFGLDHFTKGNYDFFRCYLFLLWLLWSKVPLFVYLFVYKHIEPTCQIIEEVDLKNWEFENTWTKKLFFTNCTSTRWLVRTHPLITFSSPEGGNTVAAQRQLPSWSRMEEAWSLFPTTRWPMWVPNELIPASCSELHRVPGSRRWRRSSDEVRGWQCCPKLLDILLQKIWISAVW